MLLARCSHMIGAGCFFLTFDADIGMMRGYTLMLEGTGCGQQPV
jgi:hypothetical protein